MLRTHLTPYKKGKGFTLVEFMISIMLRLSAILVITSIYITSFSIDSKTIKFSRLNDEVTSIMALLSEDIKRAGYFADSEELHTRSDELPPASSIICTPAGTVCPDSAFRTIEMGQFAGESNNSCILFAYDIDDDASYDSPDEAFGYRLNDGELETRQGAFTCTQGNWQALTDPDFVTISDLLFTCKVSDDGDNVDYETNIDADGNTTNIELDCAAGNLPYAGLFDGTVTVEISFTATLVDDSSFAMTTSEKVLVRNISYD